MNDQGTELHLPEDRKGREPIERPLVNMGEGNVGYVVSEPDDPINVSQLLFKGAENPDPVNLIILEAADGNMFRIIRNSEGDGEIQDAERSSRKDAYGVAQGAILEDPDLLEDIVAEVGRPFVFGSITTPNIVRVSAINRDRDNPIPPDRMRELAQGRTSDVLTRWEEKSHPPPEPRG